jgi:hypothetical protein
MRDYWSRDHPEGYGESELVRSSSILRKPLRTLNVTTLVPRCGRISAYRILLSLRYFLGGASHASRSATPHTLSDERLAPSSSDTTHARRWLGWSGLFVRDPPDPSPAQSAVVTAAVGPIEGKK